MTCCGLRVWERQQRRLKMGVHGGVKDDANYEINRWGGNSATFRPRWSQSESATHLRDALSRRPVAAYLTTATDHDANGAERIVEHKYQCVLEVCNTFLTPAESRKVDNVPALLMYPPFYSTSILEIWTILIPFNRQINKGEEMFF